MYLSEKSGNNITIMKLDQKLVLFVCPQFIQKYVQPWVSHIYVCPQMKSINSKVRLEASQAIVKRAEKRGVKLICFLYNSMLVPELLSVCPPKIKIVTWHQKNYYGPQYLTNPTLARVLEYSLIASSGLRTFNHDQKHKYVCVPFPCYVNPEEAVTNNPIILSMIKEWSPYVFTGGENQRDYRTLVTAMRLIPDQKCIIVTRTKYKSVMALNPPSNCRVINGLPRNEFLYLLRHSKAVVLPFKGKNSITGHNLLAEACYFSRPVIGTRRSSFEESISEGWNGYLIEPGNPQMLATTIQKTLINPPPELIRGARRSSKNRTIRHFIKRLFRICWNVLRE